LDGKSQHLVFAEPMIMILWKPLKKAKSP
jgi:hypothetical protein